MRLSDKQDNLLVIGKDYPKIKGNVKLTLHNPTTGKNEVYERHNAPTHALRDIFANNYGGLVNYQNFADLYNTWLGGVLLFASGLDVSTTGWEDDYGIPAKTSNACVAHAGQVTLTDQADDLTRGNPDNSGIVLQSGSTKLVWEWGTSAGNGTISSLGLTHTDTGSYGCGVLSTAQKSLTPFVDIGCLSRSYSYGDNANAPFAINGNVAYGFYYSSATTVDIFVTPINNTKFKLQGGALLPLTDYTTKTTVTIPTCTRNSVGDCYYHFDFTAGTLTLWRVQSEGGTNLLQDVINLSTFAVTSTTITVTGARLWKHRTWQGLSGSNQDITIPTQAIVYNGYLFVYAYSTSSDNKRPDKMFKINLANTVDISEVTVPEGFIFTNTNGSTTAKRNASLGGIIVNDSFLINGDSVYPTTFGSIGYSTNYCNAINNIVAPTIGINTSISVVSVCKLYLATKWNLPSAVTKTSAQSMTVEYTLTEV